MYIAGITLLTFLLITLLYLASHRFLLGKWQLWRREKTMMKLHGCTKHSYQAYLVVGRDTWYECSKCRHKTSNK